MMMMAWQHIPTIRMMMMIILFESFKIFQVSSGGRDGGDTALHCAALFGHPLVVQVVVVVYCSIIVVLLCILLYRIVSYCIVF